MTRPALELADLLREGRRQGLLPPLSHTKCNVVNALTTCRTAALGGHVDACDRCEYEKISYNSCRNRHCPKCQGSATADWLQAQEEHLLPVPYAHVVFTLPALLAPIALQNPRIVYNLLFEAASQTLLQVAANRRHLGARLGFLAILHTWGQTLQHHPHLHCVIPAGGLAENASRWIDCRPGFFLPVRVLSRLFRGKFIALLEDAFRTGKLHVHGQLEFLAEPRAFHELIARARDLDWVVYAKPPFGGPQQVLKYLARYTHRVAISNHRLLRLQDGKVTFSWQDYRHHQRRRVMTLELCEFVRRFLLHVLPHRFVKIRYYGFLAQSQRATALATCHRILQGNPVESARFHPADAAAAREQPSQGPCDFSVCPLCQRGRLRRSRTLPPWDSS